MCIGYDMRYRSTKPITSYNIELVRHAGGPWCRERVKPEDTAHVLFLTSLGDPDSRTIVNRIMHDRPWIGSRSFMRGGLSNFGHFHLLRYPIGNGNSGSLWRQTRDMLAFSENALSRIIASYRVSARRQDIPSETPCYLLLELPTVNVNRELLDGTFGLACRSVVAIAHPTTRGQARQIYSPGEGGWMGKRRTRTGSTERQND
ncbi:hypothetical protein CIHG_06643 [Coccidioides immitis H538.4]|uniref:Uncharacterized protein n=1 Tax=Coccidioides immitis H538.4 TaxID=396776 RepID=A0A0J8RV97_COCIT|nr:hypothetical protein CIHG_06643 [Coccidioides immitis H538.4]